MLSRRAADSENNTVPRITVADTLVGCAIGYNKLYYDFFGDSKKIQGYDINRFSYDYCLKPNSKLVYDSKVTNEHWLVCFNKETMAYKPTKIGTLFVVELTASKVQQDGKLITLYTSTKLTVECKEKIQISKNKNLAPGFYELTIAGDIDSHVSYEYDDKVLVRQLTVSEFNSIKNKCAPSLSLEQLQEPLYSKW